jgi:hypothetical protein
MHPALTGRAKLLAIVKKFVVRQVDIPWCR